MEHNYELELYRVYIQDDEFDDFELTLTYFTTMSYLQELIFVLIRGAIQKFVDKCREINNNRWIRLKIYEYKYHYERYSKFHSKIQTNDLITCN